MIVVLFVIYTCTCLLHVLFNKNQLDGGSLGWGVRFEFCVGCVAVSVSCSTLPKLIQALFQNDINLVLTFVNPTNPINPINPTNPINPLL